jgi:hypothetical protein
MTEQNEHEEEVYMTIPLEALTDYWHPMADNVWGCGVITVEDVLSCEDIFMGRQSTGSTAEDGESFEFNVARIAWLAERGWATEGDPEPITVDVGVAGYTPHDLVLDGNHRLAAAIVRGDKEIKVAIAGDIEKARAIFFEGVHMDDYGF